MSFARTIAKGAFALADRFRPVPPGPRVLIYHQVGVGLGRQMEVTLDDFERQLDHLSAHHEVVPLDRAVERWSEPDAERLVVLTFDDGYRDVHATVFPRLAERGMPFTLYLTTHPIESGEPMGPIPGAEPLTWDQVGDMVASGLVTIGAHTHTHPDLRGLDRAAVEAELATSDALIVRHLGERPRHFAYPWGYWSSGADEVVADRYETATIGATPSPAASPPPTRLPRYPVQLSDGFRYFPARLRGGLAAEEWIRRRLRGYEGP